MGMEKYMGYGAKAPQIKPERLLPEIDIAGTLFHADIAKLEFRQVGDPANRMPIIGAKEEVGFSHFFFDTQTKNVFAGDTKMPHGIPDHVRIVLLPPLKEIDPVGLARQQGFRDDFYTNRRAAPIELTAFSKQKQEAPISRKAKGQRF